MANNRPLKGVVLAAGLGTRLRPLTDLYPKPLIPFCGTTPLELALKALKKAGIDEVAINAHWLPEQVEALAKKNPFQQKIKVSVEPVLLDTGGVYNPLRDWQGDADLAVINGDVVSDVDVASLIKKHREGDAIATLALLSETIPGENAVFHRNGRVTAIGKPDRVPSSAGAPGSFACVQVLTRRFVDLLPKEGVFNVRDHGWLVALSKGLDVGAFIHTGGLWHDLRSPSFYWMAVKDWLHRTTPGSVFVARSTAVDASATLGPNVAVEAGAVVGKGAVVRNAVLLPGARVEVGETVEQVILGPGTRINLD